jgi:hypothetical protein
LHGDPLVGGDENCCSYVDHFARSVPMWFLLFIPGIRTGAVNHALTIPTFPT